MAHGLARYDGATVPIEARRLSPRPDLPVVVVPRVCGRAPAGDAAATLRLAPADLTQRHDAVQEQAVAALISRTLWRRVPLGLELSHYGTIDVAYDGRSDRFRLRSIPSA